MHLDHLPASTVEGRAVQGDRRFVADSWFAEDVSGERGISVDQTNESVVVGERAIVKWAVALPVAGVRGAQPAGARLAALSGAGFDETPRPWGLLHWVDDASDPGADPAAESTTVLLASVTTYLDGALDGWDWAVADVGAAAIGRTSLDEALVAPKRLGGITARMHVALAAEGVSEANPSLTRGWQARALAELEEAGRAVGGSEGERLRAVSARVAAAYSAFLGSAGTPLIAVHGDFHVGQVLRRSAVDPTLGFDYAVTDFDGNPVLAPEERAAAQPAALDVAGMLASLDHVGRVVVRHVDGASPEVVRTWIDAAQEIFLAEYVGTLARHRHLHLLDERLLRPMRLQQEVREFLYAVRHLPHWVYVPHAALVDLLPDEE
jgi:maltokinase